MAYYREQQGSVIIFALIMLIVVLSISMGLINIFVPKLKSIQDASNSAVSIYAADTAVELCLYEARQQPAAILPRTTPVGSPPNYGTILANGAVFSIASLSASPVYNTNDCRPMGGATGERAFNIRSTGYYKGISRAFEISQQ